MEGEAEGEGQRGWGSGRRRGEGGGRGEGRGTGGGEGVRDILANLYKATRSLHSYYPVVKFVRATASTPTIHLSLFNTCITV